MLNVIAFSQQLGRTGKFFKNTNLGDALSDTSKQDEVIARIAEAAVAVKALSHGAEYEKEREERREESLFALLAFDRDILRSISERGGFSVFSEDLTSSDKMTCFIDGDYTERDRLMFFAHGGHRERIQEDCFDEDGEPTKKFYDFILREGGSVWDYCLCREERAKLNAYKKMDQLRTSSFARDFNDEQMFTYFDDDGNLRPEFWRECFDAGDYAFIRRQNGLIKAEMGLSSEVLQFIDGAYSTEPLDIVGVNGGIEKENIIAGLTRFLKLDADDWYGASEDDLRIKEAFNDDARDVALARLREIYEQYLNDNDGAVEFPLELRALADYMHKNGGAGVLTQIEAFLDFAGALEGAGEQGRILTTEIERKMSDRHWTNVEKANFYAVSAEVLKASPEIYDEFAELLGSSELSKDEFDVFAKEIYPLYRAKLALLRKYDDHSNGIGMGYTEISYGDIDRDELKSQLHNMLLPFNLQEISPEKRAEGIMRVQEILRGEITGLFREKFGILSEAVPSEFSKRDDEVVGDMTLYLGNLARATVEKKDLIGFYLALQLGNTKAWDRFRSGDTIAPGDYVDTITGFHASEAMRISRENDPVSAESTRITDVERLNEFRHILQHETTRVEYGGIQTVDLKLQSLISGVQELTDPDLYPEGVVRDRVRLLGRHSVKEIGTVASKMFQSLSGRNIVFSDAEVVMADEIREIFEWNGIEISAPNINNYFQTGLKGVKEPFRILESAEKTGAMSAISRLQEMLMPSSDVVRVFGKLGEEFRSQSGVLAVGEDLDFLENLVVKHEDSLSEEEKVLLTEYIDSIRQQMAEVGTIYDRVVESFDKMMESKGNLPSDAAARMEEIGKVVHGDADKIAISTTCTGDMLTIIENMRACLSCKTKGINNDTDLTFGEGYKFYLYSKNGTQGSGSMTDEIVYFVPVGDGEDKRMGFVMDQVYGRKNKDIFINHIETMLKKARGLKAAFPEIPISVVVPDASSGSCSVMLSVEGLSSMLESMDDMDIRELSMEKVFVPKSGYGEHYIEFGGGARTPGERYINGVEIVLQ